MFEAEATWLETQLRQWAPEQLSPLLNVGSSTRAFRETAQPWADRHLFRPLRQRGIGLIHLDARDGEGIDIRADILSDADLPKIMAIRPKAILCCSLLEHVHDPRALARRCMEILGPGGLIIVTVPRSYPRHRDPIDTMFRPDPDRLAKLFHPATMLKGEIIDVGESYRGQIRRRPWLLVRHLLRSPFPFIGFEGWKRSMAKLYWLTHNYKMTCGLFQVQVSADPKVLAPVVDRGEHRI
jgi:SAM-dependent methyltransferase